MHDHQLNTSKAKSGERAMEFSAYAIKLSNWKFHTHLAYYLYSRQNNCDCTLGVLGNFVKNFVCFARMFIFFLTTNLSIDENKKAKRAYRKHYTPLLSIVWGVRSTLDLYPEHYLMMLYICGSGQLRRVVPYEASWIPVAIFSEIRLIPKLCSSNSVMRDRNSVWR